MAKEQQPKMTALCLHIGRNENSTNIRFSLESGSNKAVIGDEDGAISITAGANSTVSGLYSPGATYEITVKKIDAKE